jgi:hypothetical protein
MPRQVTVDALKRARFPLVELCEECWSGKPQLNPTTVSDADYKASVGPFSGFRLEYGEITDDAAWLWLESGWPGEYGRRDNGHGFAQVYTNDRPPEEAARTALRFAASFSQAVRQLRARDANPTTMLSDETAATLRDANPETVELPLDGMPVRFSYVRALGLSAASANLPDRVITVSGRFEPNGIALQTADIGRYIA